MEIIVKTSISLIFGSEQPGETYYYSPLNVFIFGICDHATEILSAYVYQEGEGKKGGNNVTSLLYKKIEDEGMIGFAENDGPGYELCLVFDNCGAGQNKNRMVLRFAQYLIDIKIFQKVEIVFLVMGHTKNICDRRFKDLKQNFHTKNVYTYESLLELMKKGNLGEETNQYLDVVPVNESHFYDWDSFLNIYYRKTISGVSKFHCFFYSNDSNGIVTKKVTVRKQDDEYKQRLLNYTKKATASEIKEWNRNIMTTFPFKEIALGISEIKQFELYTKWRDYLLVEYRDIMCPKPDDNIIERIKDKKIAKAKKKAKENKERLGR